MEKINEFFYCYSPNLHEFLRTNGQRYICAGLNENTMRKFWQYKRTPEFERLLATYTTNNPNR
ncbi:hypothetical protein NSQ61_02990 [Aeribacillus sp. FSL K6-1121]|uniref:hypothetical protein n=1 Tax=Aeribacillus sp. FSL K6-1121 TaxID=2954745 RepID=UPI0030F979F3